MYNLALGLVWTSLRLNIDFSSVLHHNSSLQLIPTFLGYYILLRGLTALEEESTDFIKLRPPVKLAIAYHLVLFLLLLLFGTDLGFVWPILNLADLALSFYITYGIVRAFQSMEQRYQSDLRCMQLKNSWIYKLAASALVLAALFVTFLAGIARYAGAAANLYFLWCFFKSKGAWETLKKENKT